MPSDWSRFAARGAGVLWLVLAALYGAFVGPLALIGVAPAVALLVGGDIRQVLLGSVALGLAASVLGVLIYFGTTSDNRIELAGFVVIPLAATFYAALATWRLDR